MVALNRNEALTVLSIHYLIKLTEEERENVLLDMIEDFDDSQIASPAYNEYILSYFLSELKWQQGYSCKKCGGKLWWKGKRWLDRRCQDCSYNESPTAGTLFHKLKFSLLTAFQICFRLSVSKKGCPVVS